MKKLLLNLLKIFIFVTYFIMLFVLGMQMYKDFENKMLEKQYPVSLERKYNQKCSYCGR